MDMPFIDESVCSEFQATSKNYDGIPTKATTVSTSSAISFRSGHWEGNSKIPPWVDVESVGLDQFFTSSAIASSCYLSLLGVMRRCGAKPQDCLFVEPSAGAGAFLKLLPPDRRVGLDVMPMHAEIEQCDFLSWVPDRKEREIVFIGNPPFGHGSWLALSFMNHAAKFAKYVGFILPMAFQSDGKGSPKHRVKGMRLVHSEVLPANSFVSPSGKVQNVNALWQVWERGDPESRYVRSCDSWADIFTVDDRSIRKCGQDKIAHANCFIQRTFYGAPPKISMKLSDVRSGCAYGIIIKHGVDRVLDYLKQVNWSEYSNLATCNRCHVTKYHITRAIIDGGFCDD